MKTTKTKTYSVSDSIQKLFIRMVLASYAMGVAIPVYFAIRQYGSNPNLSSFLLWVLAGTVMPLLFALIALGLHPRRKTLRRLNLAFETLLLAVVGVAIAGFISQLFMFVQQFFVTATSGYWGYVTYEIIGMCLALALFTLVVLRIRRSQRQ